MLYRALRGIAAPTVIDKLELWQIAVLLGEDETADYEPQVIGPAGAGQMPDGTGPTLRVAD